MVTRLALILLAWAVAQPFPEPLFPRIQMPGVVGTPRADGWFEDRSSVELDALRYEVALSNSSTAAFIVDQRKWREVFTVRVRKDTDIPVTIRWLGPAGDFTKIPVSQSTPDSVQIEPRKSATWTMVIQRNDGQKFTWGEYQVLMTMANLRPIVSSPGGGTWGGLVADRGLWLRVVSVKR